MRRPARWATYIFLGLISLLAVLVAGVYVVSSLRMARHYDMPVEPVVAIDSATAAAGGHLAIRCTTCHGNGLGGEVMLDDPMFGRIVAPNISTILPQYSDAEMARLIRHGIKRDGRATIVMPAPAFYHLSDADVAAIIAFVRSVPASDRVVPEMRLALPARALVAAGVLKPEVAIFDHAQVRVPAAPPGPTPEYGRYVAMTICRACHGLDLSGGPGPPPAPSLAIVRGYTRDEFERTLLTGIALNGRQLDTTMMQPAFFKQLTPDEIDGLYAYLSTWRSP